MHELNYNSTKMIDFALTYQYLLCNATGMFVVLNMYL